MKKLIKDLINKVDGVESRMKSTPNCLLLSTGRTGTKFFEDFFDNNFKDIYSVHEPKPDLFRFGIEYHRNKMKGNEVVSNIRYFRRAEFKKVSEQESQYYVESNPFLAFLAPLISEAYYHPKIIHIVRHPYTYIMSAINKDPDGSGGFFMTENDHRNRLNANDFKEDPFYGKWESMNQFERVCWNWSFVNSYVLDHCDTSKNYLRVRFEDLFYEDTIKTIEQIIDFMGIRNRLSTDINALKESTYVKKNETKEIISDDIESLIEKNKKSFDQLIDKDLLLKLNYDL